MMNDIKLPFVELLLIAGTRAALGVGIGLLVASKFTREQRRAAGMALVGFGGLTTIPLLMDIASRSSDSQALAKRAMQTAAFY